MSNEQLPEVSELGVRILKFLMKDPVQEKTTLQIRDGVEGKTPNTGRLYLELDALEKKELIITREVDSNKPERGGRPERVVKITGIGKRLNYEHETKRGEGDVLDGLVNGRVATTFAAQHPPENSIPQRGSGFEHKK